jgi:Rrf2 family protein
MAFLSKRTRYVLHGLAFLATAPPDEVVPFDKILRYLRDYSQKLTLSPSYIAKMFQEISRAGFAHAIPGPKGGYRLARDPEDISLIEIIETLDGPILSECCLLSVGPCPQTATCGIRKIFHKAELSYYQFFENETVASLAKGMTFPDLSSDPASSKTKTS